MQLKAIAQVNDREWIAQNIEVKNLVSKIQDKEALCSQEMDGPTILVKCLRIAWVKYFSKVVISPCSVFIHYNHSATY